MPRHPGRVREQASRLRAWAGLGEPIGWPCLLALLHDTQSRVPFAALAGHCGRTSQWAPFICRLRNGGMARLPAEACLPTAFPFPALLPLALLHPSCSPPSSFLPPLQTRWRRTR